MALLDLILGYDCNLFCDYCTITPEMRSRALSTRDVVLAMRRARSEGYDEVSFTGGEPTIRRDLLSLIRESRRLGFGSIKVQSNGLIYGQPGNVERMQEAGVSRFHVSIHAHRAAHYERLVRREGTHRLMEAGLRELATHGVDPVADVILKTDTVPHLVDAVRWLHGLGVGRADLWFVSLTDQNRENFESMPRMTDVVPVMKEAFAEADRLGLDLRSLHVPRCLLGDSHGRAWDPGADRVKVVTPDSTFELRNAKLTPQVHVAACEGCEHREICPGVRPDYLERYGDAEIARARGQEPALAPTRLPVVSG